MPLRLWRRRRIDVIEAVTSDHRKLEDLITELQGGPVSPLPPLRHRRILAQRLVMEASRHEAAEEQYLWPVVRDACEGGHRLMRTALDQERRAKRLLDRLEAAVSRSEPFDGLVAEVAGALERHVDYEEWVLTRLGAVLSDEVADRVGLRFRAARAAAPTRPYPRLPPVPGLLKVAAKTVGRLDRARDLATWRGR